MPLTNEVFDLARAGPEADVRAAPDQPRERPAPVGYAPPGEPILDRAARTVLRQRGIRPVTTSSEVSA